MQVLRDLVARSDGINKLFRTVFRVGSHKADFKVAGQVVHRAQKLGKIHRCLVVFAVGIDVLPQKGDFFIAGGDDFARFAQHLFGFAAAFTPADIRHDAIRAEIVTAVHNRQPRAETAVAVNRQVLGDGAAVIRRANDPLFAGQSFIKQFRQAVRDVRAEHQIYKRIALIDAVAHALLLHHTAAKRDNQIRVLGFVSLNGADIAEHAVFGVFANGAGIV